jgi:hypothetical protein
VTATGAFTIDTDVDGKGTLTFDATFALDPSAGIPISADITTSASGDVQISAGDDGQVTIAVSNVTAGGQGQGAGPGMEINMPLPTTSGGGSALTGTAGFFCE